MLTTEAYLARKWRSLPVLRSVLEGKPSPVADIRTSVDETPFSRLEQLAGIAALAVEHRDAVRSIAASGQRESVHSEIERLADELAGLAGHFSDLARRVSRVHDYIEQPVIEP